MLMGDTCTRGCRFCAVTSGNPHGVLDLDEPKKVAMALAEMDLTYVVLTSVDRDDLEDGGAGHFAKTVREIKARRPDMLVEALSRDCQGDLDAVRTVVDSGVDVLDHNIETVERLQGTVRDRRAGYAQSLKVLRGAKEMRPGLFTKSSIMLGLGETRAEVLAAMRDLHASAVDIMTVGQYLRPSNWHLAVQEYVPPEEFEELRVAGESMGFAYVAAGPLVRPAYREPGAALWRGFSVATLIAQAYGNAKDPQQGRQMPNHYGARDINYVPVSSPVGTQIPQAVGAAWAAKIRKEDIVALTYFGDGATSEGDFHAAMNFAGVFKTPTIFFCKNNQWAISVPVTRQTASKTLAQKALGYGFDGVRVDGNDLLAVYAVPKAAADKARSGGGPTMIEAVTYRMGPHSSSDHPTRYRSKDEVGTWAKRDPIERMRKYLELKGLWSKDSADKLRIELEALLQTTIKEVERSPPPPIETLFTDVYAELTPQLKEQMEAFLASGERRRPEMLDKFPL